MAAQHGPHQSQRDELLATPGEDLPAWVHRIRDTAVLHPGVLAQEETRRNQAWQRAQRRVSDALRWLVGCLAALVVFAVLAQTEGLSPWLVVASVIAVAASVAATVRANQLAQPNALDAAMPPAALRPNQVVRLNHLDERDLKLLERGRQALDAIFPPQDDPEDPSARPAEGIIERQRYEWMLAETLREITRLRARYEADPATEAGASVRRELEGAQEQAEQFVRELEANTSPR